MKRVNVTTLLGMGFGLGFATLLFIPGKRVVADERPGVASVTLSGHLVDVR